MIARDAVPSTGVAHSGHSWLAEGPHPGRDSVTENARTAWPTAGSPGDVASVPEPEA